MQCSLGSSKGEIKMIDEHAKKQVRKIGHKIILELKNDQLASETWEEFLAYKKARDFVSKFLNSIDASFETDFISFESKKMTRMYDIVKFDE